MRLLVITLHTIENEFDECVESIRRQTYRDFEHLVFENLPSSEAHEKLYGTFMDRADEFQLLVKVDADIVLEDADVFAEIVERMSKRPEVELLTLAIRDGLLGCRWLNLHTYRNTVRFPPRDSVYHDNHGIPPERTWLDWSPLGGDVIHCKDPSPLQSFHFGIHRGIKLCEAVARRDWQRINAYAWFLDQLWSNFQQTQKYRAGLAALGGELTVQRVFDSRHMNYADARPEEVLSRLGDADEEELARHVRRLRRVRLGFLGRRGRSLALRYDLPRVASRLGIAGKTLTKLEPGRP